MRIKSPIATIDDQITQATQRLADRKQQIDNWLAKANAQLAAQDFEGTLRTCQRILRYLPKKEKLRAEALGMMGMALALQKKFEDSYQSLSQAVQIDPDDSYLLFNRGLSARFTSRTGQSLQDFERVSLMPMESLIAERLKGEIKVARKVAYSEMALRGKGFTLGQLIEQQEYFQQGNNLSMEGRWEESEAAFRKSIEMGDGLPQPWGNLGICLVMQNRFDEAEAAYKRALVLDPRYKLAKENLKGLDYWRKHPDEKPEFMITSPFQNVKTNITFFNEE